MCIGKNVVIVPRNVTQKDAFAHGSLYMRPVTFGNQQYIPPSSGKTAAPKMMKWKCATTKYVSVVGCSNWIAANMIPDRPTTTFSAMKLVMKSSGARKSGLPRLTVKSQAKIWIVDG